MMPECVNKWASGINWNQGFENHPNFPSHLSALLCWFDSYPSAKTCFFWVPRYMRGDVNPKNLLKVQSLEISFLVPVPNSQKGTLIGRRAC